MAAKKNSTPKPEQASADQDELPLLLLVDDSEAILALEKAALGSTYRLETAVNGRLALESMQSHVPDGVVLDLSMPEMDGDAVLVAMRQDPRLAAVPVLVVSTESQRARDTLRLGADDFLPKPVTAEDLKRRVAGVLEAAARQRAERLRAFLFFRAGGMDLGLPLEQVSSVAARPALRALPSAPAHVPGYFEAYGEPVALLDLGTRLGLDHGVAVIERKVVVAEAAGVKLGLEVDEVWDPEGRPQDAVLGPDRFRAPFEKLRDRLLALVRCSRGLVPVLNPDALMDEGELEALRQGLPQAVKAAAAKAGA
jgi:CheY-like chemotaxis protein